MKDTLMKVCLTAILLFPGLVFAAVPTWEIIPNESKITFTATQNNSPVSGEFKSFSGEIKGDVDQLDKSSITLTIDTGSLSTSYKDLQDTLKDPDWFSVKVFPKATFTANKILKTGDKTYQAEGTLTVRDKTIPLKLDFTLKSYDKNKAVVTGSAALKRLAFGVGQGEWKSTEEIKDDVTINFTISAIKK